MDDAAADIMGNEKIDRMCENGIRDVVRLISRERERDRDPLKVDE